MAKRSWLRSRREPPGLTLLAAVAAGIALLHCGGEAPLTAASGATLAISANPTAIPAVNGVSTITVLGFKSTDDGGGPLANGTQISFATTVGAIEERVEMRNGSARAYLRSDGRAGTATVTARSGGIEPVSVDVQVSDAGNLNIVVTASPPSVGPPDFTSEIVATVSDSDNNRVPDVALVFSTTAGVLASRGTVLRTNPNGQATDRLTLQNEASATVTVTSGSASGSVTVSRRAGTTPVVSSVTPSSGSPGCDLTVTVSGLNFQPGAVVSFGDGVATRSVEFINSSTLRVDITIDNRAREAFRTVTVTNPDGASGALADGFRVAAGGCGVTIAIASVNPNVGAQGATLNVTIFGTGFVDGADSDFGGGITVNSTTFVSATQLIANISIDATAALGPRTVQVQNPDGQTAELPNGFSVVQPPLIAAVNPDNGDPGEFLTPVFVVGDNFASGASVDFGSGITVDNVQFIDPTLLQVDITISATATPGLRDVTVTNPDGGTGTLPAGFRVN